MPMSYYLYILKSEVKETYYIGISNNPETRTLHHNSENKGYTQRYRPWKLVYTSVFESKDEAQKAERIVKKWKSKKMVSLLIARQININDYL